MVYLRLWWRDPEYTKTLNFITPQWLRRYITKRHPEMELVDLGYTHWRRLLHKKHEAQWGYTGRIIRVVGWAKALGLLPVVEYFGKKLEIYSPISLVCRKKEEV